MQQIFDTAGRVARAAVCAAVVLGACSQDDGGPRLPIDDLPRAVADALCNNIGPCCAEAGFPHDAAQCVVESEKALAISISTMRRKEFFYDGVAAQACVDAYVVAGRTCGDPRAVQRACRRVFTGALEEGQSCADTSECSPGHYCQRTSGASSGRCVNESLSRGRLGEACGETCTHYDEQQFTSCTGLSSNVTTQCYTNDRLFCNDAHLCAPVPALGQPCTAASTCAGDTFCDTTVSTCAARRTSGSCGEFNDACAAEAFCSFGTHECDLRKPHGAACTRGVDECVTTDFCIQGTCRTRTIATPFSCFDPNSLHTDGPPAP